MSVVRRVEEARHHEDERDAGDDADSGARNTPVQSFEDETHTRRGHDAAGDGVGDPERPCPCAAREEQRERPETGRESGEQSGNEDRYDVDRVHVAAR